MAQATVLAAGTTAATSTDITVAAGEAVTVGLFLATAGKAIPPRVGLHVVQDSPGRDNLVIVLSQTQRSTVVAGPGTFRVTRPAYIGPAIGVFTES